LLIGITPPSSQAILDTSRFIGSRSFTSRAAGTCRPDRDFPLFVHRYREGKLKLDERL
jgi:Zn-dependent alcohol dehydrogenase